MRRALRSLTKETADRVAGHLVAAGQLVDEDAELAYQHAVAARALGGRVGLVREAVGIAAYAAGHWAEALAELRAARRMTGSEEHLPLMADCERALGRPEKALDLARSPEAAGLPPALAVELLIVASGARRDLGQPDAAVVTLQGRWLEDEELQPWTARLWYAYADALLEAGRAEEAVRWFTSVTTIDVEEETDAEERLEELLGGGEQDAEGPGLPGDAVAGFEVWSDDDEQATGPYSVSDGDPRAAGREPGRAGDDG